MSLKLYPLSAVSQTTTVRQPKELICFSRDIENKIHLDDSELRYYYLPDRDLDTPGGIDLNAGYAHFKKNPKEDVGELESLLKAVESYEKAVGKKIPVDIITWRGLMRQLMMLPYESRDKIVLNIVVLDNQLFIQSDVATVRASRTLQESHQTELNKKQMYSGYKFETIASLDKVWAKCSRKRVEKRFKHKVNNIEQYCSVVRTTFGTTKLLMGAEVDCAWDYKPDIHDVQEGSDINPLNHYVELKTTGVVNSPKTCEIFESKLLRAWAQCFLVGIPKIIYGFRDKDLILRSVEEFKTEEVPLVLKNGFAQKREATGATNKCMHCLKFFIGLINWLNENIQKSDSTKTYRLEYDPITNKNYVHLSENDEQTTKKLLGKYEGPNGGMLTDEFREWRRKLSEKK
ncbi:hypothetical protein HII12_004658 [Brettanomyces bruxellensis]|uniref:Decapping nuclease n=1 Tax=Dekkera bruxellensis TaxID=5007 RepID=A0A8H6B982_DEKBR|nr:hypothetical protein HII12_004658 [Brettanomyces bruxellensis]